MKRSNPFSPSPLSTTKQHHKGFISHPNTVSLGCTQTPTEWKIPRVSSFTSSILGLALGKHLAEWSFHNKMQMTLCSLYPTSHSLPFSVHLSANCSRERKHKKWKKTCSLCQKRIVRSFHFAYLQQNDNLYKVEAESRMAEILSTVNCRNISCA